MADEQNKGRTESVNTPKANQEQTNRSSDTLVHVELIGKAWMEPRGDGSFKRWHQGDKLDIPQSLYDKLGDGNHFKPSFRKVEKEA
jgi:hypothetical protein